MMVPIDLRGTDIFRGLGGGLYYPFRVDSEYLLRSEDRQKDQGEQEQGVCQDAHATADQDRSAVAIV